MATVPAPVTASPGATEPGTPDWHLARLIQRIGKEQSTDELKNDYATGNHPLPTGDKRYVKALRELQRKANTNYVGLALKAATQRMNVSGFKWGGAHDRDADVFWKHNSMEFQSLVSIMDAAKFGRSFILVSPPDESGIPVITVEDPRLCAIETDPLRPMESLAGAKLYKDDRIGRHIAILYLPDRGYVYYGPKSETHIDFDAFADRASKVGIQSSGFEFVYEFENPLGVVPLKRGLWQPDTGLAECEDAFSVQDRINHTMLDRMIITKSQAYRQRLLTGAQIPKGKDGSPRPPFDPGADSLWVIENPDADIKDLQQASIGDLLEAIRDDIGDFAAITQTPVTFLTNRMVNVSGEAMKYAHISYSSKVRRRMNTMGWLFENIVRTCYRYLDDDRAFDPDAETKWDNPEVSTTAELADMVQKFSVSGVVPDGLILERAGFSDDEIDRAVSVNEERRAQERAHELERIRVQAGAQNENSNDTNQDE